MQALFALILCLSMAASTATTAGQGETCRIGGFIPLPCDAGLTCVVSNFGNPPVDAPRVGTCQDLETKPPVCTVAFCSMKGAAEICKTTDGIVASCGAWAARRDIGGVRPMCPELCTLECVTPRLVASDGSEYCNLCLLQGASCDSGFRIFGPVVDPCKKPISIFEAGKCCDERRIGCKKRGEACSTMGSRIRPVACEKGLTCVITNFGFPAADRPNSGTCRKVRKVKKCSVKRCSKSGPKLVCKVPRPRGSGIVSTCKSWARRSDGNPRPDCDFACPEFCLVTRKPVGSNGVAYCNICKLRQASCRSDFMIFGPVRFT